MSDRSRFCGCSLSRTFAPDAPVLCQVLPLLCVGCTEVGVGSGKACLAVALPLCQEPVPRDLQSVSAIQTSGGSALCLSGRTRCLQSTNS